MAAPVGAYELQVPGTHLWLLPQAAVWLPQIQMVFVADVHFGKAAAFRHAGQAVPHGTTSDNLARLDGLLAITGAQHLVFLGDFLHAKSGATPSLWSPLLAWRERHAALQMTLVRGNHDLHAGDPPAALRIDTANAPWHPSARAPLAACHHPGALPDCTVLAGHLHPTTVLRGPAHDRIRLPCFAWFDGQLVLPAFGAFTGSSPHAMPAHARLFAIAGSHVLPC